MNADILKKFDGVAERYDKDLALVESGRTPEQHKEEVEIYRELYKEFNIPFNHDGGVDDAWER